MPDNQEREDYLLDSLVITNPIYNYGLIALTILALAAVAWGVFGSIPHKIEGFGEITLSKGLTKVIASYGGQVTDLRVNVNETVYLGDTLLILRKPEIEQQLISLQSNLKSLKAKSVMLKTGNNKSDMLRQGVNQLEVKKLNATLTELNLSVTFLEEKIVKEEKLYADGLITYNQLFTTRNELSEARTQIVELEKQLSSVSLQDEEWELGRRLNEGDIAHEISKLEIELQNLQEEYQLQRLVMASSEGKVVQLNTGVSDFITAGELLITLENQKDVKDLVLDLYVPFNANAVIQDGMRVDVEPFIVDRNLYGWLIGKVTAVDEYVSSHTSLSTDLENPDLIDLIERDGPVFKLSVQLLRSDETVSGFAWTNTTGPPYKISSGTLARSFVHVKDKAPVDYLVPIFKEYFE